MKITSSILFFSIIAHCIYAEDGHNLWLRSKSKCSVNVICSGNSAIINIAKIELEHCWQGKAGVTIVLTIKRDKLIKNDGFKLIANGVYANTDLGILYAVRRMDCIFLH